jgi:hypothetical protein
LPDSRPPGEVSVPVATELSCRQGEERMSAPGYGTQALFLVTIALGAWIVHDAIAGPPTALGQSDTRAAREQSAVREPLNVLLPATSPAPVEMALVPSPRPAAAPSVQYVLLRPAGPTQSPTTAHGWHAPPPHARPGPGGEGHAPGAWDGGTTRSSPRTGRSSTSGPTVTSSPTLARHRRAE